MSVQNVKNKLIVGITGGFSTGKSTVAKYYSEKGYPVFDCDAFVSTLWQTVALKQFANKYLGTQDKKKVRSIIFEYPEKKQILEKHIHSLVFEGINEFLNKHQEDNLVFIDMPLLFEIAYQVNVDYVVLVKTNEKTQYDRGINRKYSEETIKQFISHQFPLSFKEKNSDFVINNNQSIEYCNSQAQTILDTLIGKLENSRK